MEKIWTKEAVLKFLRDNPLASLAINGKDYPVSSMVLFYVDDDFNLYFGTGRESFKAKALLEDPKISFSGWKAGEALMQWSGTAEEVVEQKEIDARMDDIIQETKQLQDFWPPMLGVWKKGYILFKIRIGFLRVLDLSEAHLKESASKFTDFKF